MVERKRSTKRVKDSRSLAVLYAQQYKFNKYLTHEQILEEAEKVAQVFDLLELVPTVDMFKDLLGCRFRKRMNEEGYRWLSVHSKEVKVYGQKPGYVKVIEQWNESYDEILG